MKENSNDATGAFCSCPIRENLAFTIFTVEGWHGLVVYGIDGSRSHYYAAITSIILQSTRVPLGIEASISTKNLDCEAVTLTR